MIQLGRTQSLRVARHSPYGPFLTDGQYDVLLPAKEARADDEIGDWIEVFVLLDSEDRIVATRRKPLIQEGEFAALKVLSESPVGFFLDMGLDRDLLLPFREATGTVRAGDIVVVRMYIDRPSDRLVASMRLRRFVDPAPEEEATDRAVNGIIVGKLPGGWRVIVDDQYEGGLFEPGPYRVGDSVRLFVRGTKEGRYRLASRSARAADSFAGQLLTRLRKEGGFLPLHDGSPAEQIRAELGVSKTVFKQTVGTLFRQGKVRPEPYGIRLTEVTSSE